jgi:hypothetical protein
MKKIVPISLVFVAGGIFIYPYFGTKDFIETEKIEIEQALPELTASVAQKDISHDEFQGLLSVQTENFFFDEFGNLQSYNVTHIETPDSVRAIYMTSWVAGRKDLRKNILDQIKNNQSVNAVVIDIKDATGKISFPIQHPLIEELESSEKRIPDIREFIAELHENNIYVIGRISVFQDPHLIQKWPEEAVKKQSNPEENWVDRKQIGWMNASSEKVWEYVNIIAEESYKLGFDEINFDYIRFPSDGNMKDIQYNLKEGKTKQDTLEDFFKYTSDRLRPQGIIISADIFGMTTVNTDDLGIGQVLEKTLPYFDYVCPMVYPSHFPENWANLENPAENPYEVIKISMGKAVERTEAMGESKEKLRPWLQDFDLGAVYSPELVEAQIRATYELGLDSWLMWDPRNSYTFNALKEKTN